MLVTDAHILVHAAGGRAHVFVSDVETGEPIAGARCAVTTRVWFEQAARSSARDDECRGPCRPRRATTAATLLVHRGGRMRGRRITRPGRTEPIRVAGRQREWRIYAFTDRPAYRPEETVQWKILARMRDDERWMTPAGSR